MQVIRNWKKNWQNCIFFLLHLFPFTEQTDYVMAEINEIEDQSFFLNFPIHSSIAVNKNRFKKKKEFVYSIILFDFHRRSYSTHLYEYGQHPSWLQTKKGERYIGTTLAKTSALFCVLAVDHIYGSGCTYVFLILFLFTE